MRSPILPVNSGSTALERAAADVAAGRDLDDAASEAVFAEIMSGSAPAPLVAELLLALRAKGESAAEIAGAVRALRSAMRRVDHPRPELLVDTCGTGGGAVTTVNISTAAAFLAAGAGVPIAKHGNRSYTSRSGSADVLEALGIAIDLDPEHAARVLADVGSSFSLRRPTIPPCAMSGRFGASLAFPR